LAALTPPRPLAATGAIIAYVSLAAAQIDRAFLPKSTQRNGPAAIPALLLRQLAVDLRCECINC